MKNYRLLRVNGVFHDTLIQDILIRNKNFNSLLYRDALKIYEKNSFVYSFSFTNELQKLGNETIEILADFKELQALWAKENNFKFSKDNWVGEILFEQIRLFKPDIIYFQSHHFLHSSRLFKKKTTSNTIELIKSKFNFIKKIIVYSGFPTDYKLVLGADMVFYSPPSIQKFFKKAGIKSYLMYHYFDEKIFDKIKLQNRQKKYNLTFLGSSRYPETRYYYLKSILEEFDIKIWLHENYKKTNNSINIDKISLKQFVKEFIIITSSKINYDIVEKLRTLKIYNTKYHNFINQIRRKILTNQTNSQASLKKEFAEKCKNPVFGFEYYQILNNSKITLNMHADLANGCVGNMRMFEATGMGSCLLNDYGSNLSELFEDGKEIITFKSISDAKDKIRYLLNNPKEAEKIAKAGQIKTLQKHTTKNRCEFLNDIINNDN
tara:strand:- start:8282 stop:9586 length:1305 start_codon:yes stop_codon:yes gene_type:complete